MARTRDSRMEDVVGHMRNPLRDWPNEDVLLHSESYEKLARTYPRAVAALDWPDFRDLFMKKDPLALTAKVLRLGRGVMAVALATLGVITTAVSPWLFPEGNIWLGALAFLMLAAGIGTGMIPTFKGGKLSEWISNRFWVERLRQFYFQLILVNLDLVSAAMTDPDAMSRWHTLRTKALVRFQDEHMDRVSITLHEVLEDHAFTKTWIVPRWHSDPIVSSTLPEAAEEALAFLRRQRLGIQRDYAKLSLQNTSHSARWRSWAVRRAADAMTVLVLLMSFTIAVSLLAGVEPSGGVLVALTVTMALVTGLRTLEKGFRYDHNADRMTWYRDTLDLIDQQFDDASNAGKIRLLRKVEDLSYREMRRFLLAHYRAQFV